MARAAATGVASGVWKKDSVKDVAESVGIANLPDEVAVALAGDVEYRLWEIIEESIKFMRHSRRTRLKVDDVDNALKARNLEPLWGFAATSHLPFKKTSTPTGTVYHVDDEEVDLSKVLKSDLPTVPRDVSYTAHWLAIEGVQPLVKENPTPAEIAKLAPKPTASSSTSTSAAGSSSQGAASVVPLVKHVLSRELQLYFTRLTEALSASGTSGLEMRQAALGSVMNDPGLHQLVPYLIGWGGDQISNNLHNLDALERALSLFYHMLNNPTLFLEPYLHQLTPPILTCLLTSSLPPTAISAPLTPTDIRVTAASLLEAILSRYSLAYPSLRPRVIKTLLRGLGGDERGLGARYGAALGLTTVIGVESSGNKVVRDWIGSGLKALGELLASEEESEEGERVKVASEILNALHAALLQANVVDDLDTPLPTIDELQNRYGPLFGQEIENRWDQGGKDIWDEIPGSDAFESGDVMEE